VRSKDLKNKGIRHILKLTPGVLGLTLITNQVLAQELPEANVQTSHQVLEQIEKYSQELNSAPTMGQVNSITQLRDVSPSDWAYDALRNLVENYDCIEGYPNRTYRGDRSMTRYEFAAGLSACLDAISGSMTGGIDTSELDQIRRLVKEFEAELATLGTRVDDLEGRVAFLEDNQFSMTTKLEGNVIFGILGSTGGDNVEDKQIAFGHRTRLNLNSSFSGEDNLLVRLQAQGLTAPNLGTNEGSLAFVDEANNDLEIDALVYHFPLSEKTEIAIIANGGASDDFASTVNILDGDGNQGALTNFGTRHPIYYQIEDKGIGLKHQFNEVVELSLGYMASDANNPNNGQGLFNGAYGSLAQVLLTPTDNLEIGLTYLHSYNQSDTGTGSNLSNFRQFTEDNFGQSVPTSSNSYGIEMSWQLSDNFVLGGWGGYSNIRTLSDLGGAIERGKLDVWNWAVTLAFPDLGKEGNLGGIVVGMEPKVTDSTISFLGNKLKDNDTSLHIEAFYQYAINDHIAITPGIIWLTAPDHNRNNDSTIIGTIRTLFTF
jgi:hypothetical protein